MKNSLIICTYMRPKPLLDLLETVRAQTLYPDEILIVDGSTNSETEEMLGRNHFPNLVYFQVGDNDRGLTKQRNFGIARVSADSDVVSFLDDDTLLEPDYFKQLLSTYAIFPDALGVGGYITNEVRWTKIQPGEAISPSEYAWDGYKRKDGSRFVLRKKLGLDSDKPPGFAPEFSHGRSVGFLPPSAKIYNVEQFMGGVSSFRREVFASLSFSTYFEGYGLYEDADFCYRLGRIGKLYVNTAARLEHHHAPSGRPNQYRYGKMVVRNGWYVWRVNNRKPSWKARLKWHSITLLLIGARFSGVLRPKARKQALTESVGRMAGYVSLFFNRPR